MRAYELVYARDGRMRLQHVSVAIAADGADAARAFYGGLLGLEEKPVPPKLDPNELVWFRVGGDLELHLLRTGDGRRRARTSASRSTAASTSCAPGSKRPEVETRTPTEIVGRPRFMCRDPFGNLVELTELRE